MPLRGLLRVLLSVVLYLLAYLPGAGWAVGFARRDL
jgi:uncharacterized membrane protein YqaE (UPF0057 family)